MLPLQKILCPTDFSETSFEALNQAGELARHFGAELLVMHVLTPLAPEIAVEVYMASPSYEEDNLAAEQQDLQAAIAAHTPADVKTRGLIRTGGAANEIVATAASEEADLIVIATHGLTGWRHLVFGSVAEQVVRLAPCPVLTVHAAGPLIAKQTISDDQVVTATL